MFLAAILAILVGLTLGALGGGGSILTVPILAYVLDVGEASVVATSLFIVGVTSAVGVLRSARAGLVHWRTGLLFSAAGMSGSFAGGRLAAFFSTGTLLLLFSLVMLVTGFTMLRKRGESDGCPTCKLAPGRILLIGAFVGLVTGLVGAGGGFLVVPALAVLGALPMAQAVGTSLLVITLNSLGGFAGHLGAAPIDWPLTLVMTAAASVGVLAGAAAGARVPPRILRRAFGAFVVVMGAFMAVHQGGQIGWPVIWSHWPHIALALGVLAGAWAVIRLGFPARHRDLQHEVR